MTPLEIEPRESRGVDHGAAGIVLVRHGGRRLVWRRGCQYWQGIAMGPAYAPAHLEVLGEEAGALGITIYEGGRLSRSQLQKNIKKIRVALNLHELRAIDIPTRTTLVLDSKLDGSKGTRA